MSLYSPACLAVRSRGGAPFFLAAVSAEAESAEDGVDEGKVGGGVATVAPPTPKTGRAALILKRDRVGVWISFSFLSLDIAVEEIGFSGIDEEFR